MIRSETQTMATAGDSGPGTVADAVASVAVERPVAGARASGWLRRLGRAGGFAVDPTAATIALAGFLVRGGIVPLVLPIVVLPSMIDLAGVAGVDAFSIAGQPTPFLWAAIVVIVLAATAWLIVAALFGSMVDAWLIQLLAGSRHDLETPEGSVLMEMAAVRILWLVPLGFAIAWATAQLYDAGYSQLITPSDVSTPLALRVVAAAAPAVTAVFTTWFVAESIAAIAVRRYVLGGADFVDSMAGALGQVARRPIQTIATAFVPLAASLVAIGLALIATGYAFDTCRVIARSGFYVKVLEASYDVRPILFALAAVAVVLLWLLAVAISAMASAWRSAAFTLEVSTALREAGAPTSTSETAQARDL